MHQVIIIGGNHYNALGLARVFGINGIKPIGILVTSELCKNKNFCAYSKYWKDCVFVRDEAEALRLLVNNYVFSEKAMIVPSSDSAELMIDNNIDILKENFIVPGINQKQSIVAGLMDKYQQYLWAKNNGFKIARTWEYRFENGINDLEDQVIFPCIVKPVLSSEGDKRDIKKIDCFNELKRYAKDLEYKGYTRILIQEYLKKDYEIELFGCIPYYSEKIPFLLSKHLREWPQIGGSVCCHEFIRDKSMYKSALQIMRQIQKAGYAGNIDIELFYIDGEIYLNEINFRNSGDIYSCISKNIHYPYYLYLDAIGETINDSNFEVKNMCYAMNEIQDFKYVRNRLMKVSQWFYYWRKSSDYAYLYKKDMMPFWVYLKLTVSRKIKEKIHFPKG